MKKACWSLSMVKTNFVVDITIKVILTFDQVSKKTLAKLRSKEHFTSM